MKNVSDQIVTILTQLGVKRIYGIPGDTIDSLMESLRKQSTIDFIVMRHEENGAFAATAHAKLTGEIGVVAACQGPGANHLINGLYDAMDDRAPVLAITGAIGTDVIGTRMPQETTQIKLFDDCTVYNQEVRSAANMPRVLERAIHKAVGMQGPAHISIPSDIMRDDAVKWTFSQPVSIHDAEIKPKAEHLQAAAATLNKAKKPVILYGEGARDASTELDKLATMLNAPLVHTTRSKDIVPYGHPNAVGGIGLMGSVASHYALKNCDALLIVGSQFAWREFYPESVPVVQVDIMPAHIGARISATHPLLGDAQATCAALLEKIQKKNDASFLKKCLQENTSLHTKIAFDPKKSKKGEPVHPQAFMEKLNEKADDDALYMVDAGSITIWGNNILKIKQGQRFVWCANLASLGNALGYALAAKFTYPKRQVFALCGDGGFQMSIADLPTAVMYRLPIVFVIYNNSTYKFIELEEQGEGNPPFGTHFCNPDYAMLAQAHGAKGYTVNDYTEIDQVLDEALQQDMPVVIDVKVNPDELIIPPVLESSKMVNFVKAQIRQWFSKNR
jgi:pyruvate oxidase